MEEFEKETNPSLIRQFEENGKKAPLKKKDSLLKEQYRELKKKLLFWQTAAKLKEDLVTNYKSFYSNVSEEDLQAINTETSGLSTKLIEGIEHLQKSYGIQTFPIIHNFFIDIGISKRGACKHWAEDLLKIINSMDHPHFTSFWAEAHPHKMTEHNVAVLAPKGASFNEGILIDPWRTAGKPFWILVKEDSHPWQQWDGFEPQ